MSLSFIPQSAKTSLSPIDTTSRLTNGLQHLVWWLTILYSALLPVVFLWGTAPLGFMKVVVAYGLLGLIALALAFLALRTPVARLYLSWSWWLLVVLAGTAMISAYLSGDVQDALFGSALEVTTVAFLVLFAGSMLVPLVLQGNKQYTLWFLLASCGSLTLVLIHLLVRVFGNPAWLSFGVFPADATSTLVGSFNDAGLMAGVLVLFASIALLRFPLSRLSTMVLTLVMLVGTITLIIVNIWIVWLLLAFYSALIFLYLLARDTLFADTDSVAIPRWLFSLQVALFGILTAVSLLGVLAGPQVGTFVERMTGVSYVEVRPSITATVAIARAVYENDNLLFGVGPNRFSDAWRLYKDPALNQTIFWNTSFQSGSSFVATLFVTIGILGGGLFVAFQLGLLYVWYQLLLRPTKGDQFWYSIGLLAAAGAGFIGIVLHLYSPGVAVLLLYALLSGLSLAAYAGLEPSRRRSVFLIANRRLGFLVLAVVIVVCAGSIGMIYTVAVHYDAYTKATAGQQTATSVAMLEEQLVGAFTRYPDQRYLLPVIDAYSGQLNRLLTVSEPTETTRAEFLQQAERTIVLIEEALRRDDQDVAVLIRAAQVYYVLALAGIPEAASRADAVLTIARAIDPQNPQYDLLQARYQLQASTTAAARPLVIEALTKKPNYTDALTVLAQIDIADGNTEQAIEATVAMITIEPQNPTRYFQLGVLRAATGDAAGAMEAYQAAIARDQNYANARYMLALMLLEANETAAALAQLEAVVALNPDNAVVSELVDTVRSGAYESLAGTVEGTGELRDTQPTETDSGVVTTTEIPKTDLVVPVNASSEATIPVVPPVESAVIEVSSSTQP